MVDARPYAVASRVVEVTGLTECLPVYLELVEAMASSAVRPRPGGCRRW
ncbi:hypothetical protein [Nocardia sp. NPDC057272]